MSHSHYDADNNDEAEERKSDEQPPIVASSSIDDSPLMYANYTYGTKVTRKSYGHANGSDHLLVEQSIFRAIPVSDLPDPVYLSSPKLKVSVDPHWDAKLPPASAERKKEILQGIICLLGKNVTPEMENIQISRVTKTLDGYKIWFMNHVGVMGSAQYVKRYALDSNITGQARTIYKNKAGFSVVALIGADDGSGAIHPTFNPLFIDINATDLKGINRAELVEQPQSIDPLVFQDSDSMALRMMIETSERIAALAEKNTDELAKLEMNMDVLTDPEIISEREDANARFEKMKMQLHILSEKFQAIVQVPDVEVQGRAMLRPENRNLIQDIEALKKKIVERMTRQIIEVKEHQLALEIKTKQMAEALNEKIMSDDNVVATQGLITPINLTILDFFNREDLSADAVFLQLRETFVENSEKEKVTNAEMLSQQVKKLNVDQLLEKVNHILSMYPKLKNKEITTFANALKQSLDTYLFDYPAFHFGKSVASKNKLVYDPKRLIEEMRHDHASRIAGHKKVLLEKIANVGLVKDDFDEYKKYIGILEQRFEKEAGEVLRLNQFRDKIEIYIGKSNTMVEAVIREANYLVAEYARSVAVFAPELGADGAASTLILERKDELSGVVALIQSKQIRISNILKAINKLDARTEDLVEFDRRLEVNKEIIKEQVVMVDNLMRFIIDATMPLVSQKKVLDNLYNELYAKLKSMLLGDLDFWDAQMKGGGSAVVVVNDVQHRVQMKAAAMIKAMQNVESERNSQMQPEEKLHAVLAAYAKVISSPANNGLFGPVKRGLAAITQSKKATEFFDIVDSLQNLDQAEGFRDQSGLQKVADHLDRVVNQKKKSVGSGSPAVAASSSSPAPRKAKESSVDKNIEHKSEEDTINRSVRKRKGSGSDG